MGSPQQNEIDPRKMISASFCGNRPARIGDLPETPVVSDQSAQGRHGAEIDRSLRITMAVAQGQEGLRNAIRAGRDSVGEKPHAVVGRMGIDAPAVGVTRLGYRPALRGHGLKRERMRDPGVRADRIGLRYAGTD